MVSKTAENFNILCVFSFEIFYLFFRYCEVQTKSSLLNIQYPVFNSKTFYNLKKWFEICKWLSNFCKISSDWPRTWAGYPANLISGRPCLLLLPRCLSWERPRSAGANKHSLSLHPPSCVMLWKQEHYNNMHNFATIFLYIFTLT